MSSSMRYSAVHGYRDGGWLWFHSTRPINRHRCVKGAVHYILLVSDDAECVIMSRIFPYLEEM